MNDDAKDVLGEFTRPIEYDDRKPLIDLLHCCLDKERLQTGIAGMNEKLLGEQDVNEPLCTTEVAAASHTAQP